MTIDTTTEDRLLTEVQRQQKYLAKLPEDFSFPLFNAAQALESQRRSGYRNTAAAAREIIDNAIEAKATRIDICFERPKQLKQHQRADSIHAMAFIDNGSGMLPTMARYALSWGAGTHFDDPAFIGKFGFGLPNASINQTKLVEVYTKTADTDIVTKAVLDARKVKEHGLTAIEPTVEASLPDFVQAYLDKNGLPFDHGTVVVWVEPDRISYRKPALMKEHLVDDFGVTYRYLLEKVAINVDGMQVQAVDPLFLESHARYYLAPEKKGAIMSADWNIPVKYARDPDTGGLVLSKIDGEAEIDEDNGDVEAIGAIYVRVARFPYGFAEAVKGQKGTTDANRRFEIRKNRRGMSFVRAGREIETVDVFPKTAKEHSKGMGDWPLLQSYAYHWGVEVRFDPILDEVFGITNDKQTVRPIEDLWRLLAAEKIDAQLGREQTYQRKTRSEHAEKEKAAKAERAANATMAETAAAAADTMAGKKPRVADRDKPRAREEFDAEVNRRSKVNDVSKEAARQAVLEEGKRRPYIIDFYDEPRGPFYKPEWLNGQQIVVMINRQHSFFQTLYAPLLQLSSGGDAKQALDVLLIALARAELDVDDGEPRDWYITQRERVWSSFLDDAYRSLQQKLEPIDEEASEKPQESEEESAFPEQEAA